MDNVSVLKSTNGPLKCITRVSEQLMQPILHGCVINVCRTEQVIDNMEIKTAAEPEVYT